MRLDEIAAAILILIAGNCSTCLCDTEITSGSVVTGNFSSCFAYCEEGNGWNDYYCTDPFMYYIKTQDVTQGYLNATLGGCDWSSDPIEHTMTFYLDYNRQPNVNVYNRFQYGINENSNINEQFPITSDCQVLYMLVGIDSCGHGSYDNPENPSTNPCDYTFELVVK